MKWSTHVMTNNFTKEMEMNIHKSITAMRWSLVRIIERRHWHHPDFFLFFCLLQLSMSFSLRVYCSQLLLFRVVFFSFSFALLWNAVRWYCIPLHHFLVIFHFNGIEFDLHMPFKRYKMYRCIFTVRRRHCGSAFLTFLCKQENEFIQSNEQQRQRSTTFLTRYPCTSTAVEFFVGFGERLAVCQSYAHLSYERTNVCSVWNGANGTCDTTIVFIQMNRQNGEFISNLTIWSDELVRLFVLFVRTWRRWQQQTEDAGTRPLVSTLHFTFLWNWQLDIIIDRLVFTCSNNLSKSRSICAFHLLECNQIKSESTSVFATVRIYFLSIPSLALRDFAFAVQICVNTTPKTILTIILFPKWIIHLFASVFFTMFCPRLHFPFWFLSRFA